MTDENARANALAELSKARSARRAAQALADMGLHDDAASRLYYAAFHAIQAALVSLGIQAATHAGVSTLLGQQLVKPGLVPATVARDFAVLLSLRNQADYNRHFILETETLRAESDRADSILAALNAFLDSRGVA